LLVTTVLPIQSHEYICAPFGIDRVQAHHRAMSISSKVTILSLCLAGIACSQTREPVALQANAGIDALNARLVHAYRARDPRAYAALYTDSAVFEWPAFNTVRGPAELAAMARSNWASLSDMDLRLTVSNRRVASDHATEFGAFQQSYRDSSGVRMTEFGRYVAVLVPQADGGWRMDRFFGFSDSTRAPSPRR
jgi:ketosteroid isomerase-like protein